MLTLKLEKTDGMDLEEVCNKSFFIAMTLSCRVIVDFGGYYLEAEPGKEPTKMIEEYKQIHKHGV